MSTETPTHLQLAIRHAVARAPKSRDFYDSLLQKRLGTKGKPIYDIDRGKSKSPSVETLRAIADVLDLPLEFFLEPTDRSGLRPTPDQPTARAADAEEQVDMVGIRHSSTTFGLGATFMDEPTEIEVLQFPRVWVETITYSPPALLSWVRARGRSMEPTINDGDLILLDHSERDVKDQDDIWAFTVGDTRAIKRLRVKGDRFQIFSDNPAVTPDEEPIDFVNVVARVVFIGKRS